jgi:hypothetical protein
MIVEKENKIEIDVSNNALGLKQGFSSLVDAMRFSQRLDQLKKEIVSLDREREKKLLALENLLQDLSSRISDSRESLGKDYTYELSKQIPPFSKAVAENVTKKIELYYSRALKETRSLIDSEKTKTYKSIESFLSTSPLPVLDTVIHQKFSEGAYSAKCNYRCTNDIRYEFSLDTKKNPIFGQEFKISSLGYEVKLPVSLGKSWLKKGPTPEYERLDQYVLTEAEATEGHLIAHFAHPEREAQVRMVYTRQELSGSSPSQLEINYKDSERDVDITREPSLNRFLKIEGAVKAMERIWMAAAELEKNKKLGLIALSCKGKDVLEQLDVSDFFDVSWKIIAPTVMKAFKNSAPTDHLTHPSTSSSESPLDETYVREKVALLGESGSTVLIMLGL